MKEEGLTPVGQSSSDSEARSRKKGVARETCSGTSTTDTFREEMAPPIVPRDVETTGASGAWPPQRPLWSLPKTAELNRGLT